MINKQHYNIRVAAITDQGRFERIAVFGSFNMEDADAYARFLRKKSIELRGQITDVSLIPCNSNPEHEPAKSGRAKMASV